MIKDDPASLSKDIKPVYDGSLERQYYKVLGHLKPKTEKTYDPEQHNDRNRKDRP